MRFKPSATLRILRALAEYGTIDYSDGNIPCSGMRFKEAIGEVSQKTGVVIVRLGQGRFSVTKQNQKILKKIAAQNIDRDQLFVKPHPRWEQLKEKNFPISYMEIVPDKPMLVEIEHKSESELPWRFMYYILGAMLFTWGIIELYYRFFI